MATTTNFLGLTMPAEDENYDIDTFNENAQKIDAAVSKTNKSISGNTLSALQTAIITVAEAMSNGEIVSGYCNPGFVDTNKGFDGSKGSYMLSRNTSGVYIFHAFLGTSEAIGYYYSSDWHWKSLSKATLTVTRTANNFVDATEIGRCFAVKKNGILFFRLNVGPTATSTGFSDFVEIARISGWSSEMQVLQNIPPQDGSSKPICLQISPSGIVSIYGANGLSASFYRAQIAVPEA